MAALEINTSANLGAEPRKTQKPQVSFTSWQPQHPWKPCTLTFVGILISWSTHATPHKEGLNEYIHARTSVSRGIYEFYMKNVAFWLLHSNLNDIQIRGTSILLS